MCIRDRLQAVIDFRADTEKAQDDPHFGKRFPWIASPVLDGNMAMAVLLPKRAKARKPPPTR